MGFWLEQSPDDADGQELGTREEERLSGAYEASPGHLNLELLA